MLARRNAQNIKKTLNTQDSKSFLRGIGEVAQVSIVYVFRPSQHYLLRNTPIAGLLTLSLLCEMLEVVIKQFLNTNK